MMTHGRGRYYNDTFPLPSFLLSLTLLLSPSSTACALSTSLISLLDVSFRCVFSCRLQQDSCVRCFPLVQLQTVPPGSSGVRQQQLLSTVTDCRCAS
jgi:hypothetical protein